MGDSKIGERCFGQLDWGAKVRTNVIGALLDGLLVTVTVFSFNVDSNTFSAWMTQDLLPKVPENSVIVDGERSISSTQRHFGKHFIPGVYS
jgi:hypothetical protein